MNILQILPELNVGGVETGTVDFSKYLVAHGHKSVVVSHGGRLVDRLTADGGLHYQLPVHKKSFLTIIPCIKRLADIIRQEQIDIVHARSRVPGWIAYFACRMTKTSFVTTCHGYYSNNPGSHVMAWGKRVIAVSEVIGRHMIDDFGATPEHIRLVPRSVDLDRFNLVREEKQGKSQYVISMVGRLTPLKGHPYFLQAMAIVLRSMPYVRIQIIGDAPAKKASYRQDLEAQARRLGIAESVDFMGNRSDVPQLLADSDVVVLSTITQEAFGRSILEAQACGVPVVATKVGGVVDIVQHEQTGLLVEPKDPEAMAQAVLRIFNNPNLARQMVDRAKKNVHEKYTLEHMSQGILDVYEEVLSSQKILVIKISAIGDVILVTASLKALRQRFPKAHIHVLVGKEASSILRQCPHIDGLIIYDHKDRDNHLFGFWRMIRKIGKFKFDKIIDFQNNQKSHVLSFLSGAKETIGFDKKCGFLLTDRVKDDIKHLGPVEHQFRLLNKVGIDYDNRACLELWPSSDDQNYVNQLLSEHWLGNTPNIIGINVSASVKWQTKNWPIEHIVSLCDLLGQENIRVVLTGVKEDYDLAQMIEKQSQSKPVNLAGKTSVNQLAELIHRCQAYVALDSAPLHMAAAMKTPFVALFGPTDERRHMPPAENYVVLRRSLECAPCYSNTCRIMTHACMVDIQPEDVLNEIRKFII